MLGYLQRTTERHELSGPMRGLKNYPQTLVFTILCEIPHAASNSWMSGDEISPRFSNACECRFAYPVRPFDDATTSCTFRHVFGWRHLLINRLSDSGIEQPKVPTFLTYQVRQLDSFSALSKGR